MCILYIRKYACVYIHTYIRTYVFMYVHKATLVLGFQTIIGGTNYITANAHKISGYRSYRVDLLTAHTYRTALYSYNN